MKIQINKEDLLPSLTQVISVVEKRQTLPILGNVFIKTEQGKMTLVGSDLETEITTVIQDVNADDGELTVSARKFFVLNGLAALISIPIWLLIGYWFGSKLEIVVAYIDQVKHYLIVVVVAAILAFILRYLASNKKEPS